MTSLKVGKKKYYLPHIFSFSSDSITLVFKFLVLAKNIIFNLGYGRRERKLLKNNEWKIKLTFNHITTIKKKIILGINEFY